VAHRRQDSSTGSNREVKENSDQGADENSDQNEKWAWLPTASLINRLEIVGQEAKESLLQIRFGIVSIHREERSANLLRRDMALHVHD
jgi:hypothetical protein